MEFELGRFVRAAARRRRLRGATVLIAVAALTGSGAVASGAPGAPPRADPEAQPPPRIQLVLDLSGSMQQRDAGGGSTRLEAARRSVGDIVDSAPKGVLLGVRVYGATYPGEDRATGCRDTQVAVPVGPMDTPQAKEAAKSAVAGLDARGFTPIGVALRAAADDLGPQGKRRIILVSDGEDTCAPPPPCEVAKEIHAAGVDLAIDVVGFRAGSARAQLACIAKEGGGTYVDAADGKALGSGLSALFRRQWRGYEATGTPVAGSTKGCADAPLIGPGQYTDRLVGAGDLYYRVRKRPVEVLRVSATVVLAHPVSRASSIVLTAAPNGGNASAGEWFHASEVLMGWNNVLSTGGRSEPAGPSAVAPNDEGCVQLANHVNGAGDAPLPVELLVGIEQAGTARGAASAPAGPAAGAANKTAGAEPVGTGSRRFTSAGHENDIGRTVGPGVGGLLLGGVLGMLLAARRRRS